MNQLNQTLGKYRWTICGLLFFATTVNYLDRQVLSLLKDRLEVQFNWSDSDYANIVSVFQFVYAISMVFAGRLIDWLGTKLGYALSLTIWSVGAMIHALAKSTGALGALQKTSSSKLFLAGFERLVARYRSTKTR